MTQANAPTVQNVTQRLREEDARVRRLMRRLVVAPVLIGTIIVAVAYWSVHRLDSKVQSLRKTQQELSVSVQNLDSEKIRLTREIDARKRLFAEFENALPEPERKQAADIQTGLEQMQRGDYGDAVRSYQRVIEANPKNTLALDLKGTAYYEAKDYKNAVDTLQRAVEADSRNADAYYKLALALLAQGQNEAALEQSDIAFKLDSNLMGRVATDPNFWPLRKLRDARDAARTAASPREQEHIKAGIAAAQAGQLRIAVAEYDQALAANPANADVLNWRGYALYRMGQFDAARESLERAVKTDPQHAEAFYNLALALWQLDAKDEAAQALRHAFELSKDLSQRAKADKHSGPIIRYLQHRR